MSVRSKRVNLIVRDRGTADRRIVRGLVAFLIGVGACFPSAMLQDSDAPPPVAVRNEVPERHVDSAPAPVLDAISSKVLRIPGVGRILSVSKGGEFAIELRSDDFFQFGTAVLRDRSRTAIHEVALLLKEVFSGSMIEIEGHTDDSPVLKQRKRYPSNWELSAARAASLLHAFEDAGFRKSDLKISAFGDSRPVAVEQSDNRRIILRVTQPETEGGR